MYKNYQVKYTLCYLFCFFIIQACGDKNNDTSSNPPVEISNEPPIIVPTTEDKTIPEISYVFYEAVNSFGTEGVKFYQEGALKAHYDYDFLDNNNAGHPAQGTDYRNKFINKMIGKDNLAFSPDETILLSAQNTLISGSSPYMRIYLHKPFCVLAGGVPPPSAIGSVTGRFTPQGELKPVSRTNTVLSGNSNANINVQEVHYNGMHGVSTRGSEINLRCFRPSTMAAPTLPSTLEILPQQLKDYFESAKDFEGILTYSNSFGGPILTPKVRFKKVNNLPKEFATDRNYSIYEIIDYLKK